MSSHQTPSAADLHVALERAAQVDHDLLSYPPRHYKERKPSALVDSLLVTGTAHATAKEIFNRLRWGGLCLFVTMDRQQAVSFSIQLASEGFEITQSAQPIHPKRSWFSLNFFSRKGWFLVARKIQLVRPGVNTERFTYHVHLERASSNGQYVVSKEVPTLELVMARLRSKWPDLPEETLQLRAQKFSDKIFPIFLTREAAILKIVNRDLPPAYRDRVPRLLDLEKDAKGYARRLHLNWLRNGGQPLSQMEFARQSAELLHVLHDKVGVMHLDLRLDNFVITPAGVGFVDFGSAVRVTENLKENPLLNSLFEELMRTSQIQRMLLGMTRTGEVTSQAISSGLHKVDKAVDFFYLAVQISSPHSNPDLKDLILYDKNGEEARMLAGLTQRILRPADPKAPTFRSAADILKGITDLQHEISMQQLAHQRRATA